MPNIKSIKYRIQNWFANLWYRYYLKKYTTGKRTSYGFIYCMADIIYESETNPLCPRKVTNMIWVYHSRQLIQIETEMEVICQALKV
jgi:hypothetical protein